MSKQRRKFAVGDRVRFTGAFLRCTGQYMGDEPRKVFVVQACPCTMCEGGGFVATDETSYDGDGQRHIAVSNLEKKR